MEHLIYLCLVRRKKLQNKRTCLVSHFTEPSVLYNVCFRSHNWCIGEYTKFRKTSKTSALAVLLFEYIEEC